MFIFFRNPVLACLASVLPLFFALSPISSLAISNSSQSSASVDATPAAGLSLGDSSCSVPKGSEKSKCATPRAAAPGEEQKVEFSGVIKNGATYSHAIDKKMTFELKPSRSGGWEIVVRTLERPKENLARLTPPLNDLNDLYIEIQKGEVPGKTREFIFSPQVGKTIQGHLESNPLSEDEVERIRHDGHGTLEMVNLRLGKLNTLHPVIDEMDFDVKISFRELPNNRTQ